MKTQSEIQRALGNFYGTEQYYGHSLPGCKTIQLTDGCAYLREAAECFWLFDIIASILGEPKIKPEEFLSIKLKVKDNEAVFTADDGNNNILYTQKIEYTSFPLDEINLFLVKYTGTPAIIMLPSEY